MGRSLGNVVGIRAEMTRRAPRVRPSLASGLSPLLFATGAATRRVLKDEIISRRRRLARVNEWSEPVGQLDEAACLALPRFEVELASDRSHNRSGASLGYSLADVPAPALEVVERHRYEIERYLGANFRVAETLIFRNFSLPRELQGYDVYSNVWHQDTMLGNRLLKLFIALAEIGEADGPLSYVPSRYVTDVYFSEFRERYEVGEIGKRRTLSHARQFTGPKGAYVFVNTAYSLHSAGIPTESRDMLQVVLLPEWVN